MCSEGIVTRNVTLGAVSVVLNLTCGVLVLLTLKSWLRHCTKLSCFIVRLATGMQKCHNLPRKKSRSLVMTTKCRAFLCGRILRHLFTDVLFNLNAAGYATSQLRQRNTGLPASQIRRLQSVLNATARLMHRSSPYEHITPMPWDLH